MKKIVYFLLFSLIVLFLISGCTNMQTIKENKNKKIENPSIEKTIVTKIVDGDTIIIQGGETVRLLGIDAPEKYEPYYNDAKNFLIDKILMQEVYLERDFENKDQYNRLMRWVWFNNSLINLELVKEGLAVARIYENEKYREEIINAEQQAISKRIRIWSKLNESNSSRLSRNNLSNKDNLIRNVSEESCISLGCPPGTLYVASKNSDKFHLCSCSFAKKIKSENLLCFSSKKEAEKSRSPCSSCKP